MNEHIHKPYTVNYWGSHPDQDNDDCFTGADYATLAEAEAVLSAGSSDCSVQFIQLDGPNVNIVVGNPNYSARECALDDSWQREQAMQAGMAFGCEGYNDAMGWSVDEYE